MYVLVDVWFKSGLFLSKSTSTVMMSPFLQPDILQPHFTSNYKKEEGLPLDTYIHFSLHTRLLSAVNQTEWGRLNHESHSNTMHRT
jgi:hypothetical protein